MTSLGLLAPMSGWLGCLDDVPDAVFAGRLMGDGVAIDPTGTCLYAPCAGTIVGVHHTRHAVTLRSDIGAELLMHIGIDTVALGGAGFTAHVVDGQRVAARDRLIEFDLDILAERATSLQSPIILTNGDAFEIASRAAGAVEAGDWMMEISALVATVVDVPIASGPHAKQSVVVPLAYGIHARPAAVIANAAKRFAADIALGSGDRQANAKSPVAMMALGLRHGDTARLTASGTDAVAAVAALARLIEHGLADDPVAAPPPAVRGTAGLDVIAALDVIAGVRAAPGLAIGVAVHVAPVKAEAATTGRGIAFETAALAAAIGAVGARLDRFLHSGSTQQAAIIEAHLALLDDPEINAAAVAGIAAGASAGAAWSAAMAPQIAALHAVDDPRIAARAADLVDLDYQIVAATLGAADEVKQLPQNAILIADDLLPSQLMALDASRVAGFCTARGGPTSHVAIIAAAMNIPAIVAAGPAILGIVEGMAVILDGDAATLHVAPPPAALEAAERRQVVRQGQRLAAYAAAADECCMADGTRIEVFANLGNLADAATAVAAGAEGCGLLRTELMFLDRATPPGEDEQAAEYQAIAATLGDRPLIVRTLDIGGDKPIAYLTLPPEDNPALGLRGIRVGFWRPELLRTQLRAILRVEPAGRCRILLPMIASVAELAQVRAMVDALRAEMGITTPVSLGVMIETPAAAMIADQLAAHADFFAIGTNDLAQYTLAMDRTNPLLAAQVDALHPAVLRLIAQAIRGAAQYGRPVGVCGGLASDLAAAPILIGLGVTELSAVPAMIPELKALVRTLTMPACVALARRALDSMSAAGVRSLQPIGS